MADMHIDLVSRAKGLFDLLRRNAEKADVDRRLPEESFLAMREAGIFRMWNARRYGGYEASPRTQFEVSAELARACSASGWIASLIQGANWMAHWLPGSAQDEIFGEDPDAAVAGVITPGPDPAKVTPGGYRISGRWGFASGCLHSTWCVVPAQVITEDGPDLKYFFVPRREIRIEDTWFTLGMRGTASNTIVADDLFVPEHRTFGMLGPKGALAGMSRSEHTGERLFRVPVAMLFPNIISGAVLGIAHAAMEHVERKLPKRAITYSTYTKSSAAPSTQIALAEAKTRLDMATMLAERGIADCDAAARTDEIPGALARARARNDAAFACREAKTVVDSLLRLAGASSVAETDPMNRFYRDISTASLHAIIQPATTLESYGAALCGEPIVNTYLA